MFYLIIAGGREFSNYPVLRNAVDYYIQKHSLTEVTIISGKARGADCILCGNAPSTVARRDRLYGEFTYNGIDRIDNNLGYIKGNVQSCCKTCNIGKGTLSCEEWIEHCNRVANHNS